MDASRFRRQVHLGDRGLDPLVIGLRGVGDHAVRAAIERDLHLGRERCQGGHDGIDLRKRSGYEFTSCLPDFVSISSIDFLMVSCWSGRAKATIVSAFRSTDSRTSGLCAKSVCSTDSAFEGSAEFKE